MHEFVSEAAVRADMKPYRDCGCSLERANGRLPSSGHGRRSRNPLSSREGRRFRKRRCPWPRIRSQPKPLAAAADELRDDIVDAWRVSLKGAVGYPPVMVSDILAGRVDLYDALFGLD